MDTKGKGEVVNMKNQKHEKDYYKQLDGWVGMFEQCGYCPVKIEVVTDKIVWCWRWKKITEQQKNELCDRMVEVMKYMV